MHILFVGFVWPEPTSSAAGQNILSYIHSCLSANWQVSFCSGAEPTLQTFDLESISVNCFNAKLNCNSFNLEVTRIQPDVVIFDRFLSFEQFAWRVKATCPNALLVLDAEDLHFLREGRRLLSIKQTQEGASNFMQNHDILAPQYQELLYNKLMLRELACIYQADLTLLLSDAEQSLLNTRFLVALTQLAHIPFIIAKNKPMSAQQSNDLLPYSFDEKQDFVFIGNFRHAPNYQAVKVLREQCWPKIQKVLKEHHPNISCHVYGAYMSPKAKQLENTKINFFMHGYAPKQFDVINSARVMLAPITFGAGVKGKLLDAMQCHTPSVTTPVGSEGISLLPWSGYVAKTANEFIQSAIDLYTEPSKWQDAVSKGMDILCNNYDHTTNQQRFIDYIANAHCNIGDTRKANFMQQLLWQRQFQTSQYMSQWIEAKNANQA